MFFKAEYTPRLSDFNRFYELSPEAALRFFEDAGDRHSMSLGRGVMADKDDGLAWIIAEWNYRICAQPKMGDKLTVNTWTFGRMPSYSVNRVFRATDPHGRDILKCEGKFAVIEIDTLKPVKFTEEMMAPYDPVETYVFEKGEFSRLREPKENLTETTVALRRTDMDYNGHLHNTKYITLALEAIKEDVEKYVRDFQISYRSQLKGDRATVRYTLEDGRYVLGIYSAEDTLCAIVSMK